MANSESGENKIKDKRNKRKAQQEKMHSKELRDFLI
jgi:hypothetical protein